MTAGCVTLLLVAAAFVAVVVKSDDTADYAPDGGDYDHLEEADYDDFVEDGHVLALTENNFDEQIKSHKYVLAEFYAPWCTHCKALAPEFASASLMVKQYDESILLAKIDATVEEAIAARFNVEGYPTLKWFVDGQPTDYTGGRGSTDMFRWVKRKTSPATREVDSIDAAEQFNMSTGANYFVVGYFASPDGPEYFAFRDAALATDETFGFTTKPEVAQYWGLGATAPAMAMRKIFDEPLASYGGAWEVLPIAQFTRAERHPLLPPFEAAHYDAIFAMEHQVFYIASSKDDESTAVMLREVARAVKLQMVQLAWVQTEDEFSTQLLEYFGVLEEEAADQVRPAEAVVLGFTKEGLLGAPVKYVMKGPITAQTLQAFAESVADATATPHFKSDPVPPPEENNGPVKVVVGDTFESIVLDPTKDVLLEVYAPWCGHCKELEPVYNKLGKRFSGIDSVVIAKMDGTTNEHPLLELEGFPHVVLFPAREPGEGGDALTSEVYEGDRTLIGLTRFLKQHATIPYELPTAKKIAGDSAAAAADGEGAKDEL